MNFLLVDDSAMNRKVVRRLIEHAKNVLPVSKMEEAADGNLAVDAVRASIEKGEPFDCIFMDMVCLCVFVSFI